MIKRILLFILLLVFSSNYAYGAVAWKSSSAIAASTGADVTVTLPAYAANDIILLQVNVRDQDDTITWPSGYSQLATGNRSTVSRYWWAWKRATASETNPLIDKSTATGDTYAAATVYSGAITSENPFETVGSFSSGTLAAAVITGINTLTAGALVIASANEEDNLTTGITSIVATDPASLTVNLFADSGTGSDGGVGCGSANRTAAGATGNVTFTWNAAPVGWGGIVFSLKPEPSSRNRINIE